MSKPSAAEIKSDIAAIVEEYGDDVPAENDETEYNVSDTITRIYKFVKGAKGKMAWKYIETVQKEISDDDESDEADESDESDEGGEGEETEEAKEVEKPKKVEEISEAEESDAANAEESDAANEADDDSGNEADKTSIPVNPVDETPKDSKTVEKKKKQRKTAKETTPESLWDEIKASVKNVTDNQDLLKKIEQFDEIFSKNKKNTKKEKRERKPTAYNKFISVKMKELKDDGDVASKDRLGAAAKIWKNMSPEEKNKYIVE